MPSPVAELIRRLLDEHRIVLFMKGSRFVPSCGYSAAMVEILARAGADYHDVDVSTDRALCEGVEAYRGWPSFPQLFVTGELVGGIDLVRELERSGELGAVLARPAEPGASAAGEAGEPGQASR